MLSMALRVHVCACIHFCLHEKGFKIKDSLPKLVNDYMTGKIMLNKFITHKMDLEQINDAVKLRLDNGTFLTVFFYFISG